MVRVPGAHHQQAEVTARHRSRDNPHVANEHPAANQPQVAALVQQVPHTPQGQETHQVGGSEITAQRVRVLQAQEQELVDRLALAHDGGPQVAGVLARAQHGPGSHASGNQRNQNAGTHQTLTHRGVVDAPHLNHTAEEHGHGEYRRRNHRVRVHQGQAAQAHQNRQGQGENDGVLAMHHDLNHVR